MPKYHSLRKGEMRCYNLDSSVDVYDQCSLGLTPLSFNIFIAIFAPSNSCPSGSSEHLPSPSSSSIRPFNLSSFRKFLSVRTIRPSRASSAHHRVESAWRDGSDGGVEVGFEDAVSMCPSSEVGDDDDDDETLSPWDRITAPCVYLRRCRVGKR